MRELRAALEGEGGCVREQGAAGMCVARRAHVCVHAHALLETDKG